MRKFSAVVAPAAVITLAMGALLASVAWYARPVGDDFCTAADTRTRTPLGVGLDWFLHFNGRTANGVASAVFLTAPEATTRIAPMLWIAALAGALYLAVRRLAPQLPAVPLAAGAALVTVAAFLVTATPYDSLFWVSAAVSHVLPLVLCLLAIAWIVARPAGLLVVPVVLGIAIGQTNEAIGLLLAVTVVQVVLGLRRFGSREVPISGALSLAAGALAGTLLTIFSPGSFARREVVDEATKPLHASDLLLGPFQQAASVLADVLLQPGALAAALAGLVVGLAAAERTLPTRPLALAAPGLLALEWTLGVIGALTLGYRSSGAAPRAYIAITFAVLVAIAWYGALLGNRLATRRPAVAAAASVVAALALAAHTPDVLELRREAKAVAITWDAQDRELNALPAGTRIGNVHQMPIGFTPQPSYYSSKWLLTCLRKYHHLDGVKVVKP